MTEIELAWLSGLLEGEGCFGKTQSRAGGTQHLHMTVTMTDRDVIERAARLMGVSVIAQPVPNIPNRKPQYRARLRGSRARALMIAALPYMGERRTARIQQLLAED